MTGRMRVPLFALAAFCSIAPVAVRAQDAREGTSKLTVGDVAEDLGSLFSWLDDQLEKGSATDAAAPTEAVPASASSASGMDTQKTPAVPAASVVSEQPAFVPPTEPIVLTGQAETAKSEVARDGLLVAP